jgi:predicted RNase H-like HicB family nuclease
LTEALPSATILGKGATMKFLVTLEPDEAGWIVVECPSLPGCLSQGRTVDEALANIREAIEISLETRREHGLPAFVEVAEVEVETTTD